MNILKLRAWYRTPMGHMVRRVLQTHINKHWESVQGKRILVLGYGQPYAKLWLKEAQVFCGMSGRLGSITWPDHADNRTCLLWDDEMPFGDCTFDAVFVVHGLEFSNNAEQFLKECHRVLKDDGQFLLIAPNRTGAWSRVEDTPFGRGEPYSARQISRLLRHASLTVNDMRYGLYAPPYKASWVWAHGAFFERWGRVFSAPIGGVHIVSASKDTYGGIVVPSRKMRVPRRALTPELSS